MARCFKVTVVCQHSFGTAKDFTNGIVPNHYVECDDGILYVVGEKPSDVEKIVDPTKIKEIIEIGLGYSSTE